MIGKYPKATYLLRSMDLGAYQARAPLQRRLPDIILQDSIELRRLLANITAGLSSSGESKDDKALSGREIGRLEPADA